MIVQKLGSDYFYHPFADKAAFVDTLTNEKDKGYNIISLKGTWIFNFFSDN
jgi:hypothetical protein